MTPGLVEIVTTLETYDEAAALARELIEARLVACANVGQVRSLYRWKGEIVEEGEWQVFLKTTEGRADQAEARIRDVHPYDTPAVLRLPVTAVNDAYARWVGECVSPEEGP